MPTHHHRNNNHHAMTTSKVVAPTSTRTRSSGRNVHRASQPVSSSSPLPSPRFLLMRRWEEQQGVRAQASLSMNMLASNHHLLVNGDNETIPMSNASSACAIATTTTRDSVVCMLDEALMIVGAFPKSFGSIPTKTTAMTTSTTSRRSFGTTNSTTSTSSFGENHSAGPGDDVVLVEEETAVANVERESDKAEQNINWRKP